MAQAVSLALQEGGASLLRVYVGGDATDWDFAQWDLWQVAQRWKASGGQVEVVVPAALMNALPWHLSQAARATFAGLPATVRQTKQPVAGGSGGWLACEVVTSSGAIRWAVNEQDLLAPGLYWGRPDEDERVVRARIEHVPETPGASFNLEQWNTSVPGTFREVVLDLGGPSTSIAQAFWDLLGGADSALASRFSSGATLTGVEYSDRYVCSPLTAKVVALVLAHLRERGLVQPSTRVTLHTMRGRAGHRFPDRIFDAWGDPGAQQQTIQQLLQRATGAQVRVEMASRQQVEHARELCLQFEDGHTTRIRLDHGLSFFECKDRIPHDFRAPAEAQAKSLQELSTVLGVRHGQAPIAYVGG